MGKSSFSIDEIRFDVRDPDITKVCVFCTAQGDAPSNTQGWHYKTFPASITTLELFTKHLSGCVLWPLDTPENSSGGGERQ